MAIPLRVILQPLAGDAPEIVVLRDAEGLYRVASLKRRPQVDDSAEGVAIKPSAGLRERRFQSIEELEAAVASELTGRRTAGASKARANPRPKVTNLRVTQEHPQWLNPEMAKLLDENGYRHNRPGGFYFADGDCLITETQLLVSEPEWLRKLIAKQRGKPRPR